MASRETRITELERAADIQHAEPLVIGLRGKKVVTICALNGEPTPAAVAARERFEAAGYTVAPGYGRRET